MIAAFLAALALAPSPQAQANSALRVWKGRELGRPYNTIQQAGPSCSRWSAGHWVCPFVLEAIGSDGKVRHCEGSVDVWPNRVRVINGACMRYDP